MKLGILGTGFIVREGALPALSNVPEIETTAIFARPSSKRKAQDLAALYSVAEVYTDYDELLRDSGVDFVYVALVNSVHYEYAKKALQAGKNVIMEKPFASTAQQVRELAKLALDKKLYILEAVTTHYLPNFAAIKENLPSLGKIRSVAANYSQYSSRYDRYLRGEVLPAFDPKLSGGALYDINIYNINIIIGLFGEPKDAAYTPNIGFNGIDTSGVLSMRYDDFFAVAIGAKDSDSPCHVTIQGEKGWIRIIGKPNEMNKVELHLLGSGKTTVFELNCYENRMVHEFKEFAAIYSAGDYERMREALTVSTQVMETAEKARKGAGIAFACDNE